MAAYILEGVYESQLAMERGHELRLSDLSFLLLLLAAAGEALIIARFWPGGIR